jgi:alkanesulfonate monooxygenase SsuD/methylene tetrahydromethanopterin reductase-like flavin-dependent oxidoreductase (luciferase family)
MRFGVYVPNCGSYADPAKLLELALAAESHGWDGFFMWDHMMFPGADSVGIIDPWMALAAIATRTRRLVLGPLVTPLARRRPWQVAREAVALDWISGGRAVLGVGLGASDEEFAALGEDPDPRTRGDKLDEALTLITRFWSGEAVHHSGAHYRVDGVRLEPGPVQVARIPIWVAARWPASTQRPYRRAARFDGVFPAAQDYRSHRPLDAKDARAALELTSRSDAVFDLIHAGLSTGNPLEDRPLVEAARELGVTWWLESFDAWRGELPAALARVNAGPPRG